MHQARVKKNVMHWHTNGIYLIHWHSGISIRIVGHGILAQYEDKTIFIDPILGKRQWWKRQNWLIPRSPNETNKQTDILTLSLNIGIATMPILPNRQCKLFLEIKSKARKLSITLPSTKWTFGWFVPHVPWLFCIQLKMHSIRIYPAGPLANHFHHCKNGYNSWKKHEKNRRPMFQ